MVPLFKHGLKEPQGREKLVTALLVNEGKGAGPVGRHLLRDYQEISRSVEHWRNRSPR